jgi:hypothetical protein
MMMIMSGKTDEWGFAGAEKNRRSAPWSKSLSHLICPTQSRDAALRRGPGLPVRNTRFEAAAAVGCMAALAPVLRAAAGMATPPNGDWTREALEERRWVRDLVRSFGKLEGI